MTLAISVNKTLDQALYLQIYESVKTLILDGRLKPGYKLPSSRELAKDLGVSRTISSLSYKLLESEGYITPQPAVGTFVSSELPEFSLEAPRKLGGEFQVHGHELTQKTQDNEQEQGPAKIISGRIHPVSNFAKIVDDSYSTPVTTGDKIGLGFNSPSLRDFPLDLWRKLCNKVLTKNAGLALGYSPDGCVPLKSSLVKYLSTSRAVKCSEDQIIITAGSKQALDLVARIHLDIGDNVGIENPGYAGAIQSFLACRASLHPVAIDSQGLISSELLKLPPETRLVYVTPSHQYPLGATLSLQRRLDLLLWATQNSTLIVEDDYDSEFRYGERPIPSLQGLDKGSNVIYIGTFSKTIFPALRIGYIVAPPSLAPLYKKLQYALYGQIPYLDQLVLSEFVSEGHFERHIRRMRTIYSERRDLARREFAKVHRSATIVGDNAGMHFVLRIQTTNQEETLIKRMGFAGVQLRSTKEFYNTARTNSFSEFLIGYAGLTDREIKYSASALKRILSELS